jgi:hypothetical protein
MDNMSAANKKDPFVRIGVVLQAILEESSSEPKYLVEVRDRNDKITMWCRAMSRFGGAYNYEDYTLRGYTTTPLSSLADQFSAKAGDFVLVVPLAGETREGVILGGLKHPSRKSKLNPDDGPAYAKEFNGIEEQITPEGEYTLTFLGLPINQAILKAPSSVPIISPIYNPAITGSYIKFDSGGGFEINDKAIGLEQSIKLDKSGGTLSIKSGMTEFTMEKLTQAVTLKGNTLAIDSKISIEAKTLQFSVEATTSIKLKGLKIAIGSDGVELFDQLIQFVDALGAVQVTSPVGPCTPIMATPQWVQIELIKAKLNILKGSL